MRDWIKLPTEDGGVLYVDAYGTVTPFVTRDGLVGVDTPERTGVRLRAGIHIDVVVAALDGDEGARIRLDPETSVHELTWREIARMKRHRRRVERALAGKPPSLPRPAKVGALTVAAFLVVVLLVRACA